MLKLVLGELKSYFITFHNIIPDCVSFLVPEVSLEHIHDSICTFCHHSHSSLLRSWLALVYSFTSSRPDFPEGHGCSFYLFFLSIPAGVLTTFSHVISIRSCISIFWGSEVVSMRGLLNVLNEG